MANQTRTSFEVNDGSWLVLGNMMPALDSVYESAKLEVPILLLPAQGNGSGELLARAYGTKAGATLATAQAMVPGLLRACNARAGVHCHRCGKLLRDSATWLELNCRTHKWTTRDKPWPDQESQGCFPFGKECVKAALAEDPSGSAKQNQQK